MSDDIPPFFQSPYALGNDCAPQYICDQIGWGEFQDDWVEYDLFV